MAVFKYVEEGFACYLSCDRPEVNSPEAFRGLCREVFAKACPVTVGTTFAVGLLPALTDDPAENLARFAGIDGGDRGAFLGEYPERVREALGEAGVSLENLGYYYYPDEVDEAAALERDRFSEGPQGRRRGRGLRPHGPPLVPILRGPREGLQRP